MRETMKYCTGSLRFNETNYELISFPRSYGVLLHLFITREQWDLLDDAKSRESLTSVWAGELYYTLSI